MVSQQSQIKLFFQNQTVFITGGTGFVGKVLIEKLLRECVELKKIFVLVRPKKGKTPEQRFDEFFNIPCFNNLKAKYPETLKKVQLINGDCQMVNLGINDQDIHVLVQETTSIIHAAANVKFDQTVKEAAYNVRATKHLLDLALKMKNLKVFVFVSTAYSNCIHLNTKEQFYEPPMTADKILSLVNSVSDKTLEIITPKLLGKWPNTYVYSKSIAEDLIKSYSSQLPLIIVRPAIITSASSEPIPGWIDNFYGVIGISIGAALGVIRSLNLKKDAKAQIVPVDFVSNCILAAAAYNKNSDSVTIYHCTGDETSLTWKEFHNILTPICWALPTDKVVWYYSCWLIENKTLHNIRVFFLHTVLAYVADFVLFCIGRPTLAVKNYQRLDKMLDLLSYFSSKDFTFDKSNTNELWNQLSNEDKILFNFNIRSLNYKKFYYDSVFGAKKYLLKDTVESIPRGRRKSQLLFFPHYGFIIIFWLLMYKLFTFIVSLFF